LSAETTNSSQIENKKYLRYFSAPWHGPHIFSCNLCHLCTK